MKWPAHGGQPRKMMETIGVSERIKVYDFSANINPFGPPKELQEYYIQAYEALVSYPDPDYEEAHRAIAEYDQVKREQVLLTNGGAEAIFLVAQYFMGKRALIIHPTFSEYERACLAHQVDVKHLMLDKNFLFPIEDIVRAMADVDVVFLCNPNNPTGTLLSMMDIEFLLMKGMETNTTVVVDEAFVHFLPSDYESVHILIGKHPNLIVLRSLTKMFAIPSLRAGYVISREPLVQQLRKFQIPWSVNGVVASLLPMLLSNTSFLEKTKKWLQQELVELKTTLAELRFEYSPTMVNFYLLRDKDRPDDTNELFHFLIANGIVPRHTHNFMGLNGQYLRLAVRSTFENEYLIQTLIKWREQK
ncbi:threonine-phosphate decarboxylase CobD [Bacillus sp. CGMCC 1.16607]|uniref:threonine-phosphate decarboxylase CobD n=1 Tax=Bacillus sp. CGMCC 1.16607 TaxID=3351842 RepID=UPI0036279A2F